jgi:hypothetical protein
LSVQVAEPCLTEVLAISSIYTPVEASHGSGRSTLFTGNLHHSYNFNKAGAFCHSCSSGSTFTLHET